VKHIRTLLLYEFVELASFLENHTIRALSGNTAHLSKSKAREREKSRSEMLVLRGFVLSLWSSWAWMPLEVSFWVLAISHSPFITLVGG
jgi:hypothetical protein